MQEAKRRILLVEDEEIVARVEARAMTSRGYAVDRASTGEEAIGLFENGETYDIVVTDIELGAGIDGIEAARRMEAIRRLPLVFLSTHDRAEVSERLDGLWRYDYIKKGEGNDRLLDALVRALGPSLSVALPPSLPG